MAENNLPETQSLKDLIEQSVEKSVDRAFEKHRKMPRIQFSMRGIASLLAILLLIGLGIYWTKQRENSEKVAPVENHDLTLDNNGLFGFTVADFEEVILGESTRQRMLIVQEQDVYVNTTITDTGLFNWGVFNKQQLLTIHGTGQYTIDLSQVTAADISLNEETYELTIRIPHAQLHQVVFDPAKTEIGDPQNGWLAFGKIKLTLDQTLSFESTAVEELTAKLDEEARYIMADRFAKLSASEVYQPIIKGVSPAYKVIINFK